MGDEILASGQARRVHTAHGDRHCKVIIRDRNGHIREHEMWKGNPIIATRSDRLHKPIEITNGPSVRPYIANKSEQRWFWKEWECPVGEIYLTDRERAFAAPYAPQIIVEPNIKQKASPNKDWGRHRWQDLVWMLKEMGYSDIWQLGPAGTQLLQGVRLIETGYFRLACAVLARAKVAVLTEGGLHHSAAALGVKSVVIFGGFISPKQTGYITQTNLFTGGEPCGMRVQCKHCRDAMAAITPAMVAEETRRLLA